MEKFFTLISSEDKSLAKEASWVLNHLV